MEEVRKYDKIKSIGRVYKVFWEKISKLELITKIMKLKFF